MIAIYLLEAKKRLKALGSRMLGEGQALVAALWQKLVEMISSLTASPPQAPSGGWLSKLKPF